MAETPTSSVGEVAEHATLTELSVVVVAEQNNPSILNPDFLRHNNIVAEDLAVQEAATISTSVYSRVAFINNISVTAEPNRVTFARSGQLLTNKDASEIPDIAVRFLKALPHVPYYGVGINPRGFVPLASSYPDGIAAALRGSGNWLPHQDVRPEVTLTTFYRYVGRMIHITTSDSGPGSADPSKPRSLLFQANFHYDITESLQQGRLDKMASILSDWESVLDEFQELTAKFTSEIAPN